jgi:5-bromo-4-chloroindolyl phosphate hydrolysis protein
MENGSQRDREVRAARNQSLFRAVNEKLRELNQAFVEVSETYAVACECADTTCVETLHIAMEQYVEVREHPSRFVVLKDHVFADVERIVAQNDGYAIVEKNASVRDISESTDPSR